MLLNPNILPIIAAGLMNGSFVIPAKYVKNFTNEKIWLYHSIIGLALIPWIVLAFIMPQVFPDYLLLSSATLIFIMLSGAIFGLGQVCFAYAIERIGISLSFAINLGIGITIGSLFVAFYKNTVLSSQIYLVMLAILFILCSLIIYYYAGKNAYTQKDLHKKSQYHIGWGLASLAGLTSGLQNIAFVIVAFHIKTPFQTHNPYWVWPPFLLAAGIAMAIGFFYKIKKNKLSNDNSFTQGPLLIKNLFIIAFMGLFFTIPLALYSSGMNRLTPQQQVIGWPAFMVSIILASQLWGWLYGESRNIPHRDKFYRISSILLLLIAVIILTVEA